MSLSATEAPPLEEGLYALEAEFYTEQFILRATVISPEMRLSDHLNSATSTLELRPSAVRRATNGAQVHVAGSLAYLAKSHLLFSVPLSTEPPAEDDQLLHAETLTHTCWAGVGRYSLLGRLHMEVGRNPRLFLRSLEQRQFLPVTDVRLTFPEGAVRDSPTVMLNRLQIELLALQEPLA